MVAQGLDTNQIGTTNFQAVGLYNKSTGFGGVSNYLFIPHTDVMRLAAMQVEDNYQDKRTDWRSQKMGWMCNYRGSIYMYNDPDDHWQTSPIIRWGTIALGGNNVSIDGYEKLVVKTPDGIRRERLMARLVGFRRLDWDRPLNELVSLGLVHRCYCAYRNNHFGDTPKGIIYSPFWSLLDWDFCGAEKPDYLYIPEEWLED
jgi:hypothetical protein